MPMSTCVEEKADKLNKLAGPDRRTLAYNRVMNWNDGYGGSYADTRRDRGYKHPPTSRIRRRRDTVRKGFGGWMQGGVGSDLRPGQRLIWY